MNLLITRETAIDLPHGQEMIWWEMLSDGTFLILTIDIDNETETKTFRGGIARA